MPTLYLITGANGAGKSTIGSSYLPEHIRNSYIAFDGDKLYKSKLNQLWPEWDIENNFYGNLELLNEHFKLLDYLQIVDTSFFNAKQMAIFKGGDMITSISAN